MCSGRCSTCTRSRAARRSCSRATARGSPSRGATSRSSTRGCARCPAATCRSRRSRARRSSSRSTCWACRTRKRSGRELLDEYKRLTPFPDVDSRELEALRKGGVELGVLSNGDPEMLEASARQRRAASLPRSRAVGRPGPRVQDRCDGLRARAARAEAAGARDPLRVEQRLGRLRRRPGTATRPAGSTARASRWSGSGSSRTASAPT